ncbi:MAG: hypothetical protein KGO83_06395 [Paenibacillaceae bacterium]|nr:hypothetical protein [Paenibacillaceae bacterium]
MHRSKHTQRGASLIEVIGAFVLLAIITTSIIDISHSSVLNALYAKQESIAMALAQEEMGKNVEELRLRGNLFSTKTISNNGKNFMISVLKSAIEDTPKVPIGETGTDCPDCTYQIRLESIVYDYHYKSTKDDIKTEKNDPENQRAKKITIMVSW